MFKKRRKDAALAPPPSTSTSPLPTPLSQPPAQQQQQHRRNISTTSASTLGATSIPSGLGLNFDFDLPSPTFGNESVRPSTSDGIVPSKSTLSSAPPILPPIPRIASQRGSKMLDLGELGESRSTGAAAAAEEGNVRQEQEGETKASSLFHPGLDNFSFSFPTPSSSAAPTMPQDERVAVPSGSGSDFKMESSLFPTKAPAPAPSLPAINTETPMTRAWIDARDRPYAPPPASRPAIQSTTSSPDLRSSSRPQTASTTTSTRSPLSNISTTNNTPRPSPPQQSFSTGNMNTLVRPPSNAPTNYSGTTARSAFSSKSNNSDIPIRTIGTPYQETSQSFPLPQHVTTRPKTREGSTTATVAGVNVPTHHTSSLPNHHSKTPEPAAKGDRRKTRLLNPMNLLPRRRSGQDEIDGSTSRAAQQRQKNVAAAAGLRGLPEDYDPRIRGKVVHDFSAPRQQSFHQQQGSAGSRRMFSYNDALDPWGQMERSAPKLQDEDERRVSDGSPKAHVPVFKEHLAENNTNSGSGSGGSGQLDAAAIQAERLENKAFLNRASRISQESAVLPPFARRSQQMDVTGQGQAGEDEARLVNGRESSGSSVGISPITTRSSVLPALVGGVDAARDSISPISPASSSEKMLGGGNRISRPVSEVSRLGSSDGTSKTQQQRMSEISRHGSADGVTRPVSSSSETKGSSSTDTSMRHLSSLPDMEAIAEEQTPKLGDGAFIPIMPERPPPGEPVSPLEGPPQTSNSGSSIPSPQPSPDPGNQPQGEEAFATPSKTAAKLVQKRADAVGHTKRASSSSAMPKHHVSNASRFSFQFGGSAAEEQALEAKARRLGSSVNSAQQTPTPGDGREDDEEYFDEDAMDDLDEMEVQQAQQAEQAGGGSEGVGFFPMSDARQMLQFEDDEDVDVDVRSDGVTEPDSDEEAPYWMHDDFRSYTHTRDPSAAEGAAQRQSQRKSSGAASGLTLDTNLAPNGGRLSMGNVHAGRGFYMQPLAAGYPAAMKPELGLRDSGNGIGVVPTGGTITSMHKAALSNSTVGSLDEVTDPSFNRSSASGGALTDSTGLGLSGFSDFKFHDSPVSPPASRPMSLDAGPQQQQQYLSGHSRRGDSETLPQHATFDRNVANFPPGQDVAFARSSDNYDHYDLDDMYFDDGGFESDVNNRIHLGETVDENSFDDPAFLRRPNGVDHAVQPIQRQENGIDFASLASLGGGGGGGDGPYPSFAMLNPAKAKARDSRLLLEDLPLQETSFTFDPKYIPRRNPSEDAKRLGLSSNVPPLPAQGLGPEGVARVQGNLQAYHAALAEAANKAQGEGRFLRVNDSSASGISTRSGSVYSRGEAQGEEDDGWGVNGSDGEVVGKNGVVDSKMEERPVSHPPKLSFDFGFDSAPMDDSLMDDDFDPEGDDDIVAAANAEALANDDEGFYGQEFGFYAKARPNSSEVEAINGGFFGIDGDDGLARQKSLKEPNLTPITERSEFSTRNSFIGLGMGGQYGPPSAGPFTPFSPGAAARLPWVENEVTTFDQLRKLKASAFRGSNTSLHSDGSGQGVQMNSAGSAPVSARSSAAAQGYFGPLGGAPMTFGYSTDSSASSNPPSAHPLPQQHHGSNLHHVQDSPLPLSAVSTSSGGGQMPFSADPEATPRRQSHSGDPPLTARKASDRPVGRAHTHTHSRTSSGADSVTYVREQDPDGQGPPRWVLEKRRTSEAGMLELVAREVVQDGWI